MVVAWPAALTVVGWIGGAFLLGYGALAARRVFRPAGAVLEAGATRPARAAAPSSPASP